MPQPPDARCKKARQAKSAERRLQVTSQVLAAWRAASARGAMMQAASCLEPSNALCSENVISLPRVRACNRGFKVRAVSRVMLRVNVGAPFACRSANCGPRLPAGQAGRDC
ncbi:unnamed protein product [Effrenium voratum]|uniref:Uncharacterized protein n=1 Tax=Effrenium voratum TaxID=2562239 RepID=A0AA36JEN7_9DINO|nr:unnamed protein product [Effrenium voratum]